MTKLFVYFLFGIFMLTFAESSDKHVCSQYPICATNGTHLFLFKNECRFDTENINREKNGGQILQKTEIAHCFRKCDQICTDEYAPICARFADAQQTFQNRCQLDLENCKSDNIWKVLHAGECPLPSTARRSVPPPPPQVEEECPAFCTLEINPICASLGDLDQTFQNLCYLKWDICTTKRNWLIKHNGECVVPQPMCDQTCPKIFSPVCATFNGENRTFTNNCLLSLEICVTGNQWETLYNGECISPPQICPTICTETYQPVCARDNGESRTFPNKCFMNVDICKTGKNWIIEYDGECKVVPPKCPEICPFIYQPVCAAFNGLLKTFGNKCLLNVDACKTGQDWEIIYEGECLPATTALPPTATNCPDACPAVYDPVCATLRGSAKTFSNSCLLGIEVCKTGQNWEVLFKGPCEVQSEVTTKDPAEVPLCTTIYDPICAALNGATRTFPNKCEMNAENIRTNHSWTVLYPGECTEQSPAIVPTGPCPRCSDLYQPVCGIYNGEQKTFTNECQMIGENCYSNKKWVILNMGECDFCPVCTDDVEPVCAEYDGHVQTFDNSCKMDLENCKTGSEWKIISKTSCEDAGCPKICPDIYSPICASSNGVSRTFSNDCEMKMEICKTKTEWTKLSEGECPPPEVNPPVSCTLHYNPVCAGYQRLLRSFRNECLLQAEVCNTGINWQFIHAGPCSGRPATPQFPCQVSET